MTAKAAKGTVLSYSSVASPASDGLWIPIANIIEGPSGPALSHRYAEAVAHDEAEVLKDPYVTEAGDVSFGVTFDSAEVSHAGLRDAALARTRLYFKETAADTGAMVSEFNGVPGFDPTFPPTDYAKATFTIGGVRLPSYS